MMKVSRKLLGSRGPALRESTIDLPTSPRAAGVECGPLDEDERRLLRVEIDARVSRAWELTEADLAVMFDDFTTDAVSAGVPRCSGGPSGRVELMPGRPYLLDNLSDGTRHADALSYLLERPPGSPQDCRSPLVTSTWVGCTTVAMAVADGRRVRLLLGVAPEPGLGAQPPISSLRPGSGGAASRPRRWPASRPAAPPPEACRRSMAGCNARR